MEDALPSPSHEVDSHLPSYPASFSDQELIRLISQRRCPLCLEELHRRYRSHLQAVARKVLPSNADCDDVVQECLLQIWLQAQNYNPEKGQPYGWIVTIAKRRAMDATRVLTRAQNLALHYESCRDREEASTVTVDGQVRHNELHHLLQSGLDGLPEDQRHAVQLAYFRGMSQRQIASHLSLPLGTVKTRLVLALKKLSRTLATLLAP
ncbi:sigma-70 family RNA polymerase sigma factor [Verrucomicrobium sp. BvORR106]|uniref:RNA polymerase sigma factor n=1 Tax=Verrucomicrobium sp. BvORR106 TaxID=1403819 RepID=UPI00056F4B2E|nr:sigma-70 family RNA polymerase sigma factor [Verrucomicrobium sp. BvORR106]